MNFADIITFILAIFIIVIVMLQTSKDDINDAFSGGTTDLFKTQKVRGQELFLQRSTLVLSILFIIFIILSSFLHRR